MIEEEFSGAHRLRGYRGKCENLHGHNWKVAVFLRGEKLDRAGLLLDFHTLRERLDRVLQTLDHKNLNTLPFFRKHNPSSENLARYIFLSLERILPEKVVRLDRVTIWENQRQCATYYRKEEENAGVSGTRAAL